MNKNVFSVAIDGPCGAGKSSVCGRVAKALGAAYLDTGAMYRAVGKYMADNGVNLNDPEAIAARVNEAVVTIRCENDSQITILNGEDVSADIRRPEISAAASAVAKVKKVRERMVEMQRDIAKGISLVMDGRDIGTCVLPDATLKIYLTATAEERAMRRFRQMEAQGKTQPYEDVLRELKERDLNDTTREFSPLRRAEDAVEVDTTHMSEDEAVETIIRLLNERRKGENP